MKFQLQVLCAILLCSSAYGMHLMSPEAIKKFNDSITECKTELKASDDDIKLGMQMKPPTTRIQYCLMACVNKKFEIMGSDNSIKYDKLIELLSPLKKENPQLYENLDKVIKDCVTSYVPQKDECDSIKQFMDCKMKQMKEKGLD